MEVKFDMFEEVEMLEKEVKRFGTSAHIILPTDWVGCKIKVIKCKKPEVKK